MISLIKNAAIAAGILSILSGCSVFSPVKIEDPKAYVLNAVPSSLPAARKHVSLYVAPIEANAVYNTANMAYTLQPYQVSYFAKNTWAETPAIMMRPLVIQAFDNTHTVRASQSTVMSGYNYILTMQLLQLEQDFYHHPTMLHLVVRAQLLNGATNKTLAEKEFAIDKVMATNTPYSGVVAANEATREFLRELVQFSVHHM